MEQSDGGSATHKTPLKTDCEPLQACRPIMPTDNPEFVSRERRAGPSSCRLGFSLVVALVVLIGASGCADWFPKKRGEPKLPHAQVASNAIGIDILIAQISPEKLDTLESLWAHVDYMKVDLANRKRLDRNGLRVGVLPGTQSPIVTELFAANEIDAQQLDDWQQKVHQKGLLRSESPIRSFNRIQHHAGSEHPIPVSDMWPRASWILNTEKGRSIGAGEWVQTEFEIKTFTDGGGGIRIRLLPRIKHGLPHPQIDVDEDQFLLKSMQTELDLKELAFDVHLKPGEILLLGATPDLTDLGQLFFRPQKPLMLKDLRVVDPDNLPEVPEGEQKLLMIRLMPSASDSLF